MVLDAAAHAASHVLDLSQVKPDFVTLSFYKVRTHDPCCWGLPQLSPHDEAQKSEEQLSWGTCHLLHRQTGCGTLVG